MSDLRCADPACLDGPDQGARWATHGLLCTRCHDQLERRLAEMPAQEVELWKILLHGASAALDAGNARTKGSPPAPVRGFEITHDHLQHMRAVIASWVMLVREERGLRGPDRSDIAVLAPWLLGQLDWIAQQEWVREFADEIRDAARTADGITRSTPKWNRLPVACPVLDCGAHELGRMDGADHVDCRACGTVWPEAEYARFVLVAASDTRHSVTAVEGARRARVNGATFRQWVTRKKVRRLGTVDGLARYSTEDVDRMTQDVEEAS